MRNRDPDRNPQRHLPLSTILVVPFLLQLVAAVALVGWIAMRDGRRSVDQVTLQLRGEIDGRIHEFLEDLLDRPHRINRLNADAIALGELDLRHAEGLGRHFFRQLEEWGNVSFIFYATVEGGAAGVGRPNGTVLLDATATDADGRLVAGNRYELAPTADGGRGRVVRTLPGFDARERPWFGPAIEARRPVWSDVYWFFADDSPAIGANLRVDDEDGEALGVLGVDLSLAQVSDYLRQLDLGNGHTFIVDREGLLIASSAPGEALAIEPEGEGPRRRYAAESMTPGIAEVAATVGERFGGWAELGGAERLTLPLAGQPHFLHISPLTDPRGIDWWIVTVLPRADYMAGIDANRRVTLALTLLALAVATAVGLWTARKVALPMKRLDTAAQAIAAGHLEQRVPGSRVRELGNLARSFNDMAAQLAASFENLEGRVADRTQELSQSKEAAERASRAKSDFLANISHEIRTPLAAMLGYISLLRDREELSQDMTDDLATVQSHGTHLEQLLSDLLDISRIEAGELTLDLRPTSLARLIAHIASVFGPQARQKGLVLAIGSRGWLPWHFASDPLRLRQVLGNLVSNAIKYTERGSVTVTVTSDEPAPPEESRATARLRFTVEDTGVGISERDRERLFRRFTQLEMAADVPERGFGLGLAITRQLIELMGGTITVESRLGEGSRFEVEVAVAEPSEWDDQPRSSARSAHHVLPTQLPSLSGRVLVAEDAPDLQRLCRRMLERWGLISDTADDGAEAVRLATERSYDVILMDWQMPQLDGLEAARRIRRAGIQVPILALTAAAMAGDREACLAAGCTDYLGKPIDFRDLHRVLAGWLPAAEPSGAAPRAEDEELLALQQGFVSRLPATLDELRSQIRAADWSALDRGAHRLVGTAGSYPGLGAIAAAAEALESAIRARDRGAAARALDALANAVGRAIESSGQNGKRNGGHDGRSNG